MPILVLVFVLVVEPIIIASDWRGAHRNTLFVEAWTTAVKVRTKRTIGTTKWMHSSGTASAIGSGNVPTSLVAGGSDGNVQQNIASRTQHRVDTKVRIRSTRADDLPSIAGMLATATTGKASRTNSWKAKIDQLFAKSDIEQLLSHRHSAWHEGRKAHRRAQRLLALQSTPNEESILSEADEIRLVWSQVSDKFRTNLEKASKRTGEDNVWRHHDNLNIPPPSLTWLRHLQLTAVLEPTGDAYKRKASESRAPHPNQNQQQGKVIGFCEVAVLWNPCLETYTPAIVNLATHEQHRRQGVATRLLRTACRYVSLHWTSTDNCNCKERNKSTAPTASATSLGLFVEKDNPAAIALYKKLGFEEAVTCDGGDQLGEMWYMTKKLAAL